MVQSKSILLCVVLAVVVGTSLGFAFQDSAKDSSQNSETTEVNQEESIQDQFLPVDNMHHFMEYISEPAYKALKQALATEPEDRRAWRPLKAHALVLAETSALVAMRVPDDADEAKTKEWQQISLDIYSAGKALYKSIGDYDKAKEHFSLMIDSCNQCHNVFADGKHQLEK